MIPTLNGSSEILRELDLLTRHHDEQLGQAHGASLCQGFTLFTDSEVRPVCCDYVMQYWSVCKRESWHVRNAEKQGEGEIYVKLAFKVTV